MRALAPNDSLSLLVGVRIVDVTGRDLLPGLDVSLGNGGSRVVPRKLYLTVGYARMLNTTTETGRAGKGEKQGKDNIRQTF